MKQIKDFCKKHDITIEQFYGREEIQGSLYLGSLTSIPEGFNPTVAGFLDLSSLISIPEGFNPTVADSLYLSSLISIPEGFNPTVGISLDLSSLISIPEGFNPTVGGSLYLGSLISIPEGFNPTVAGFLDLSSLTSIPEGFNPTVAGSLYLGRGLSALTKPYKNHLLFWQDGKYVSADGILTEVLSKKGNAFKIRKINSTKEFWLVSNGEAHAHGDTLHKATEDFEFKLISEKLKNEPISADTIIDVKYYRLLTGACEMGVKDWMDRNGAKQSYKASELLPILEKTNAYGVEKFKKLLTF